MAVPERSVEGEAETAELTVGGVVGTGYHSLHIRCTCGIVCAAEHGSQLRRVCDSDGAELPVCGVHSDWAAAVWGVLDDIVELFDECSSALRVRCGMLRGVCTM